MVKRPVTIPVSRRSEGRTQEEVSRCTRARDFAGSLPVGARGFAVVTSVGEAHGRTPDLLPSSRRQDPEQTQPAKHPMPISCTDRRSWALNYTRFWAGDAGQQQPAAVGAVTDADTVRVTSALYHPFATTNRCPRAVGHLTSALTSSAATSATNSSHIALSRKCIGNSTGTPNSRAR